MKLAVIIDPIETLNPLKDTSIALLRAAYALNTEIHVITQQDLWVEQGSPYAKASKIKTSPDNTNWFSLIDQQQVPLSDFDIILMRKDPPFDMDYIYTTYLLELAEKEGVLVVNKPQSLRDANEKYFTMHFPEFTPTTLISQNKTQLKNFWETHQDVIYKPLEGMGGHSIFRVNKDANNLIVIIDMLTQNGSHPIMAQKYIPDIKVKGDRRILIVGDFVVPYALARIPQGIDERGNLAQGALGKVLPATKQEQEIAKKMIPTLKQKGLFFVGLDFIGNYVTEINVTSPTCMVEIEQETGISYSRLMVEKLFEFKKGVEGTYE